MRVRKFIWAYQDWMARRKLAKACPQIATLAAQRKEARRKHANAARIEQLQVELMNGLLRQ